jgi:flagellar biosynthesis GTPase FlhF
MAVVVDLRFASEGWQVRWQTPSTPEFNQTKAAFKERLPEDERYWDPLAFEGKGGWWVSYGSLQLVGDLFVNYQQLRDQLEAPYWAEYERQRQEAQARAEQEREAEARKREQRREQQRERRKQRQAEKKAEQERQAAYQPIKKPTTLAEALKILKLRPPASRAEIRRAFYTQAQVVHPDHGGSHAAMVILNAAYELALASA